MGLAANIRELVAAMDEAVDCIVVEGPHDRDALRAAGFAGAIALCSESDGLVGFAKQVAREHDRIAILTDYDAEGKELNRRLQEHIPGARNDKRWREELGTLLTEDGRRDIEAINNLFDEVTV